MINLKKFIALGLMSGTSADGIDIGVIKTDGKSKINLPLKYLLTILSTLTLAQEKFGFKV